MTRLSTDAQPDTAYTASVSSDGRYLAFSTATPGLVPGDNDALLNVFVYDRQTQTTEAVDVTSAGVRANSYSQSARISRDGRYVLFDSAATNLAGAPDTNARDDVFLRDRVAGTTERVNVSTGGGQAFWFSNGMMTPDARFIAIGSDGLSVDDHTFFDDVYVRDRQTGVTELVSVSSAGVEPTDANTYVSDISPDGRFVVMWSNSAELVPGDTNGVWDVFVRDRLLGTTERVSLSSTGAEIGGSTTSWNQVSADGRYVAFSSTATDVVPGDTNGQRDVFIRDRQLGTTSRAIEKNGGGQITDGVVHDFDMSDDARIFVFKTYNLDSNVVPGDTNGFTDVFLYDRVTRIAERVSVGVGGAQPNGNNDRITSAPVLDGEGRRVAFASAASNIVPSAPNGGIFLVDRGGAPTPIPVPQTIGDGCGNSLGSTTGACQSGDGLDVDVDGENGGLSQSVTDARLPGRGITFSFSRSYSSVDAIGGRLGPGWTYPYQAGLLFYGNGDINVRSEDGQSAIYVLQPDGSFKTPDGITSTLTVVAGGYTLTVSDQSRLSFDSAGRLTQMLDQSAQGLTFAYAGADMTQITDAEGKQVTLIYDPTSHQITRFNLPDGRFVAYTYGLDGRLQTVQDLRGGITTYTMIRLGGSMGSRTSSTTGRFGWSTTPRAGSSRSETPWTT